MYVSKDGNAVFVEDGAGDRVYVDRLLHVDKYGNASYRFEVTTRGVPLLTYDNMLLLHEEIGRMLGLGPGQ